MWSASSSVPGWLGGESLHPVIYGRHYSSSKPLPGYTHKKIPSPRQFNHLLRLKPLPCWHFSQPLSRLLHLEFHKLLIPCPLSSCAKPGLILALVPAAAKYWLGGFLEIKTGVHNKLQKLRDLNPFTCHSAGLHKTSSFPCIWDSNPNPKGSQILTPEVAF